MSTPHRGRLRSPTGTQITAAVLALLLAACGQATPTPTPPSASPDPASSRPTPSPTPLPTPLPTPRYTNAPDAQLMELIPDEVADAEVVKPSVGEFALTPGDVGEVYGEIGLRFRSLQLAYIPPRQLSLYAMRLDAPAATTADLEPYLAAAGQYVGIAGLHREPWELKVVARRLVWVRPEDDATLLGTMVYTWAADGYVFLMIGSDDALNRAMLGALPGERPPTPSPRPSRSPLPSPNGSPSATPS